MLFARPSRLLVSGVAVVCAAALVPTLEGDAQHYGRARVPFVSRQDENNCSSSTPCIGYNNAGSGAGLTSGSAGGSGLVGTTTFVGSSTTAAYGVFGMDNSSSGSYNSAVYGQSTNGFGVTGHSSANYGVIGVSVTGPSGVLGLSSGFNGTIAATPSGPAGVIGVTIKGYGVDGQATTGNGVDGTATTGLGVNGVATSGTGVYGSATSGVGVYGTATGTKFGVGGDTSNAAGVGIDGTNGSSGGVAIQGVATGSGSSATGVFGYLSSASPPPTGIAVLGEVGSTANSTAISVAGLTAAPNGGAGLLGLGTGEGVEAVGGAAAKNSAHPALSVISAGGADSAGVFNSYPSNKSLETLEIKSTTADTTLCSAAKETPPCAAGGDVYITGDVHVKGALYTTKGGTTPYAMPRTFGGGAVTFYGTAARSVRLEEDGEAQLQSGQAYVRLAADFASTIDLRAPYLVFVTPVGDRAMYVSGRAPTGFFVREVGGGRSNVPFAYRIVANALPASATDSEDFPVVRDAMPNPKRALGAIELTAQRDAGYVAKLAKRPGSL
jgi:hypothetical protein